MALVATLSASAGTPAIILNPVVKSTTVMLSASTAASSGAIQIDMTLDDPTLIALGGPAVTWAVLSSGAAMLSSNVTTLVYTVLSPIGGVRINSTANNTSNTWTLKALQSITA
jgi:hypothetical protein